MPRARVSLERFSKKSLRAVDCQTFQRFRQNCGQYCDFIVMEFKMPRDAIKKFFLPAIFLIGAIACHTVKSDFKLICDNAKKYKPAGAFGQSPFYLATKKELKTSEGRLSWEALSALVAKDRYEVLMVTAEEAGLKGYQCAAAKAHLALD